MSNVFVIGNSNTIWFKEYIKNIQCTMGNKVFISAYDEIQSDYKKEYYDLGIESVELYCKNRKFNKLLKLFKLTTFCIKNRKKIDFVDIQSPPHSYQAIAMSLIFKLMRAKVIVSFWGSDILRINKKDAKVLKYLLSNADKINLATLEMEEKFKSFYGDMFNDRFCAAKFGSLAFDYINYYKGNMSKKECKKWIGADSERITVAIGHNGNREQQHIKVLNKLSELPQNTKDKIVLVLHVGYGLDNEYTVELKRSLENLSIRHIVINDILSLDDIAKLRIGTDIIVHAQTTDALSGSIREAIYAESILINPTWIHYSEFDEYGVEYIKYNSFNDLCEHITAAINKNVSVNTKKNSEIMHHQYSWDAVYRDWTEIFNGTIN